MVEGEKISLQARSRVLATRFFLATYPDAKSTFQCLRCHTPVLVSRVAQGFIAQCGCFNLGTGIRPAPENSQDWQEILTDVEAAWKEVERLTAEASEALQQAAAKIFGDPQQKTAL
jgi:hypothetical protein